MTNDDDAEKYYYFAVKSKTELFSPEWLRSKKEAIINGDNCIQNALNDALDYQRIKKDLQRISKTEPYISQYNWKDIEFPLSQKDWKNFERNNKTIVLNILFVPHNTEAISTAYKSKYNHKRRKQVILLMITDGKKWHYLAIRSLPALLRGIASSNNGDFYYLNCFHSYRTLNKLKRHERICNNHDYCRIDMPKENEKIKYLPGEKSLKAPFIVYADLECLLEKVQYCQNNPENDTKNKQYFYREKDCIKKFCKDLKELGTEMINFKKKEMIPLTNKEIKSYEKQKVCYICEKKFCDDKNKKSEYDLYHKVRDHCHYTGKFRGAAHNICNLRHKVPKKIPIVFHNGSTYDYHFIIKQLAEEFKGQFECLGENTEKYIIFSVPFEKERDNGKTST